MTPEQFMHALAELVAEAEDAGLPTEIVADELVVMAEAIPRPPAASPPHTALH